MSTNYPGALDSFVNPTATDTLDSATVPHAAQHDNINDAMSAVQVTLGVNPQGGSATVVARLTALDSTVAGKAATNQTMYVGTTAIAINRSSASQTLTGTSIDGNAATATTAGSATTAANLSGTQTQKFVYAAPNAADGTASFRALLATDIPTLNQDTIGNAANVTGTVAVDHGGTGRIIVPAQTAWASGNTYDFGDYVTYQSTSYQKRTASSVSTIAPISDATNWAQRSPGASTYGSGAYGSLAAYNTSNGLYAAGIGIGSGGSSAPSSGLNVAAGGITVSGGSITNSGSGDITLTGSGTASINTTSTTTTPLTIYPSGFATATGVTITNGNPTSAVTGGSALVFGGVKAGDTVNATGFTTGNASYTVASTSPLALNTSGGGTFTGTGTLTAALSGTGAVYALAVRNSTVTVAGITPSGVFNGNGSSLTNLGGASITAATIPSTALASVTGTGTTIVTDTAPTINYPALTFPIISSLVYSTQPASTTIASSTTLTSAQIFSGILVSATASAYTSTLPSITTASTGMEAYWTSLNNGVAPPVNTCFEISFINTGTTNAWTITIPTGWTGVPATTWTIAAAPSATIPTSVRARIIKRSTTAYSIYRLS